MVIREIVNDLVINQIIPSENLSYKPLMGGTVSNLFLLINNNKPKYVVKLNNPQNLQAEVFFLNHYEELDLLPSLLFVEPSYQYIVYSFISGSPNYPRKNKKEWLKTLVQEVINHYKPISHPYQWGFTFDLTDSWEQFLWKEETEANYILNSHLDVHEFNFVLQLVKDIKGNGEVSYLIHWDCGVHNFIFNEQQLLCGVIDPTPIYGEPLYDLIYAYCSSAEDLDQHTLESAVNHLNIQEVNKRLLYKKVMIGLYLRIATCIKHHPKDLEDYLAAWNYWKKYV